MMQCETGIAFNSGKLRLHSLRLSEKHAAPIPEGHAVGVLDDRLILCLHHEHFSIIRRQIV